MTTRGRVERISSTRRAREGSSFWRCASGSPALRRSVTPSSLAARSASAARVAASPRVPLSPCVRSRMPTWCPALTAWASVPPHVSSTSSRWAAMASKSTSCEVTVPLRVWSAKFGMRNRPRRRRVAWRLSANGPSLAIPHSAFRTPHCFSFVSQRLNGIEPRGSRRRRDSEDHAHGDGHDRRDHRAPDRDRGCEVEEMLQELPDPDPQYDTNHPAHQGERRCLDQELPQDLSPRGARGLPQPDLPRTARHGHHHDRHHADAADEQRNAREHEHHEEECERQAVEHSQNLVRRQDVERVRLPYPNAAHAA